MGCDREPVAGRGDSRGRRSQQARRLLSKRSLTDLVESRSFDEVAKDLAEKVRKAPIGAGVIPSSRRGDRLGAAGELGDDLPGLTPLGSCGGEVLGSVPHLDMQEVECLAADLR